jgi:hypothetical protein
MDDKTLRPSTAFDDSSKPSTTHLHSHPLVHSQPPSPSYPSTSINAIVSGINRNTNMERTNPMDIKNSLMSPPEPIPQDNFSQSPANGKMKTLYPMPKGRFQPPLSPPVSPESKSLPDDHNALVVRDPILFPNTDAQAASPTQPPLFPDSDAQRVVDEHMKAVPQGFFGPGLGPKKEEYMVILEVKSQTFKTFDQNRKAYGARERHFLQEDSRARGMANRKYTPIAPAASGGRVRVSKPSGPRNSGGVTKQPRQPKPRDRGMTPDGPKKQNRDDKDFNSLPDFSPPKDSLPTTKKHSLKIDWKGTPYILNNDPYVGLLHPDEVHLAEQLRLDCATYLTSKRRIFIKRIEALKIGKEFRKTDAQQACKIDVNKASKLWQAFDKVGWLNPKWVEKYA